MAKPWSPDVTFENIRANHMLLSFLELHMDELEDPEKRKDLLAKVNQFKRSYELARQSNIQSAARDFFNLADNIITTFLKKIEIKASCKEGCSFCCHKNVDISEDEALLIADFCKSKNIQIDRDYLANQLKYTIDEFYLSPHSACIFLKDNRCSIYPVRPINCRKHYVFSPASLCEAGFNNKSKIDIQVIMVFNYSLEKILCGIMNTPLKWGRMAEMLLPYANKKESQ